MEAAALPEEGAEVSPEGAEVTPEGAADKKFGSTQHWKGVLSSSAAVDSAERVELHYSSQKQAVGRIYNTTLNSHP